MNNVNNKKEKDNRLSNKEIIIQILLLPFSWLWIRSW